MKFRLLLLSILTLFNATFSNASTEVVLREHVDQGGYYTFPEANVYDYEPTTLFYGMRINYKRSTLPGDKIVLPAGWDAYPGSSETNRLIKITSGATAEEVQNYLRNVQFYIKLGNAIEVMLYEDGNDINRQVYYSPITNNWYEYIEGQKEWWEAYNQARTRTFRGSKGTLATIPYIEVNELITSFLPAGKKAWLAGTRGDIRDVYNPVDYTLSGPPTAELDYWYWGGIDYRWTINNWDPESEWYTPNGNPEHQIFYLKKTIDDEEAKDVYENYYYTAFGEGKPDNAGGNELYLYIGDGNGKQWDDHSNKSGITGYIVEYYDGEITTRSAVAVIGYDSKKYASIDGVRNNGTDMDPVITVYGDEILYEIEAVNAHGSSTIVHVGDHVPYGLTVVPGSITEGGVLHDDGWGWSNIEWDLDMLPGETKIVSFKATPSELNEELMINEAEVRSGENNIETYSCDENATVYKWTNQTFHQGAVCHVTFKEGPRGHITGNDEPQIIDYGLHPKEGIQIYPDNGYKLAGWSHPVYASLKGENKPAESGITDYRTVIVYGDMTLTAMFAPEVYRITYHLDGGTPGLPANPDTYTIETTTFTLSKPAKDGYIFLGWTGTNGGTPEDNIQITKGSTGDRVYTANWKPVKYNIIYDGNGGIAPTSNPDEYTIDATPITLNPATRNGYTFKHWEIKSDASGVTVPNGSKIIAGTYGNLKCKAIWQPNTYSITYTGLEGATVPSPGNPGSYTQEDLPLTLLNPNKPGWKFTGWTGSNGSTAARDYEIPTSTTGNLTYQANWTQDEFLIGYEYDGGIAPTITNPTSYKTSALPLNIPNEPTRKAYTFKGWTGDKGTINPTTPANPYTIPIGTTGDLNYKANWNPVNYNITYDGNGGTKPASNPNTYNIETPDITLAPSVRSGYTFNGWAITSDEAGVKVSTGVLIPQGTFGNLHCVAQWKKIEYKITYDHNGGTGNPVANPTSYDIETLPINLNPPSRTGFTFVDWTITSDAAGVTIPNGASIPVSTYGNLHCKANWSAIAYPITYDHNGGIPPTTPNPANYTVLDLPLDIVEKPTKTDHTFVGWTGNNGTIPETNVRVPVNTTGALHYLANWNFRFADDTVSNCTPPMALHSGHDGLDYTWILPDGSSRTTADIQAQTSGKYVLHTNYGSMVLSDTVIVLFAFEGNTVIKDLSANGSKVGKPQVYTVPMNPALTNVTYQWSFSGGTPATSTADTATVIFNSSGTKTVTVTVTVTLPDGLVCTKTLSMNVKIFGEKRNFFVDRNVYGGKGDGSSWANAYRRIEDALKKATSGDCVWVARGEYTPPANTSYMLSHDSIEVYGGFGAWEAYLDERDYGNNHTILKGSGTSVIVNTNASRAARWDGFIIQSGDATQGGGILNKNTSITIANCIIRSNKAIEGGGIYSTQGNPLFYNVEISGNTAERGAAIYTDSGDPRLVNVTISGNRATSNGGGLYNVNANPQVINSIIWGNKSAGNAVMVNSSSSPYFTYTLIERYGDVNRWDESYGINGGNNMGGSPLFMRTGFDDEGNMRTGNYRLSVSSPSLNRGSNRYLYGIPIRTGTHLQTLTETVYINRIPYDVIGKDRIEFDRVDMGAYEYSRDEAMPTIMRNVYLPDVEGLILDPEPGEHYVESYTNFTFTITATEGYNLDDLTVETGNELRDRDGLVITRNEDGTATVTLIKVTEMIMVTINGVSPTLNNGVGNNAIDSEKVWSYNKNLHILTNKVSEVKVYTLMGQLYLTQPVVAGETVIPLEQGLYMIQLNGQIYKVIIKG